MFCASIVDANKRAKRRRSKFIQPVVRIHQSLVNEAELIYQFSMMNNVYDYRNVFDVVSTAWV